MALSEDLRRRIVDMVATGVSRRKTALHYQVSASSAGRIVKQHNETGSIEIKEREPRKSKLDPFRESILVWIDEQPDLTLQEFSERFKNEYDLSAPISTLDDWFRRNKISYKKNGTRQ